MRVTDEAHGMHLTFEMQRGIAGHQYIGPVVRSVKRRVYGFEVSPVVMHGESAQPCKLVVIELLARPLDHLPHLPARLANALAAERVFVVIPQQAVCAEIPDHVDALRRIAAVTHDVPQAEALGDSLRAYIRHHGFQRLQIAVNVTDDCNVRVHRIVPLSDQPEGYGTDRAMVVPQVINQQHRGDALQSVPISCKKAALPGDESDMKRHLCLTLLMALTLAASAEDGQPKTMMTQRGRLLASEDFARPPAPFTGVPAGFASGFSGWRFNNTPKAGHWEVGDGVFKGIELTESHHPATASYGMKFKDAIIQCEVRLDNVPADGRPYRNVFINVTDTKDHVCQVSLGIGGIFLTPMDDTRINPKSGQRERGASAIASLPVKLDVWHTLVFEIKGEEAVATLDGGRSVTVSNPLIGTEKHSVLIGAGTQASFRNFRVWEALPNAEWPKNKEVIQAAAKPTLNEVFRADKLAELDATLGQAIKDGMIIGAALWVERNGVAYHKAFGHRALKPEPELMTEDTIFDVASVTKVLAAASSAMLCVERGLIKLDEPASTYFPEFIGEGREKITVRHLLLHTSGMPVNLNPRTQPFSNHEEATAQLCQTKPIFEPGSAFAYSSVGSMVLGVVVERVTGKRFDAFCTSEIFKPLRMNDTGFRPSGERLRRVAPSSAPERGLTDDTVGRLAGGIESHATLFTTTADVARFARMMLNLGELDGVRVFKPETVKLMTSVQSPPDLRSPDAKNLPVQRGLGWDINTPYRTPPHDYTLHRGALFPIGGYGHTGWTGQMLWIDPASRTFVIFLCNRYGGSTEDTRPAVYQMHHRISTLAAEAVKNFDFKKASAQSETK